MKSMPTLATDHYWVEFDDTDVVDAITCAFNRFNGSLFNSELPETKIRWASSIRNQRAPGTPVGLLALPEDPVTHRMLKSIRDREAAHLYHREDKRSESARRMGVAPRNVSLPGAPPRPRVHSGA